MPLRTHAADPSRETARDRRGASPARAATSRDQGLHHLAGIAETSPLQRALAARANHTGLPDRLKGGIEALSGLSLDDVRVHRNSPRPAKVGALAYAQGTEIHLGPGQERHLPHEAWHVVQQKQGRVRATGSVAGAPLNDDPALEREATAMGDAATRPVQRVADAVVAQMPGAPPPLQREESEIDTEASHAEGERDQQERLERGDLVLAEIPVQQWATIGAGLASYHHAAHQAFAQLKAVREHGQQNNFAVFLEWYNHGVMTRSGVRTMIEDQLQRVADPAASPNEAAGPMQRRASSHTESGPKTYESSKSGTYTGISYMRDAVGTIDFGAPHNGTAAKSPIYDGIVDLETGAKQKGYGITLSGTKVRLPGASRGNHFSVANRIVDNGFGQSSPTDLTWHHLVAHYKMVLVDRKVHASHNHNGGNLLWT